MKNLVVVLLGLAALTAAAFTFAFNAFDRQDPVDLPFRREVPAAARAHITCFSGGKLILDDFATDDIDISDSGWSRFKSGTTGQRIRTSADCLVVYGARPAVGFKAVLP